MKKKLFKLIAHSLLLSFTYQLVFPVCAYALTTGPSQPEVQSFEPVGTTDMVDMFSGDFNYNIPLMDVEGYPINVFYHSGIGIEQEASWVGLGWNINPGEINRTVRGLPDDFNGEKIEKQIHIKNEVDFRVGVGLDVAMELFGKNLKELGLKLNLGGSLYLNFNNYRGISSGVSTTVGISCPVASVGIGLGIGTQTGADKDIYASLKTPDVVTKGSMGVSVSGGTGYNSRSGLKDVSLTVSPYVYASKDYKRKDKAGKITTGGRSKKSAGTSFSHTIPIGVQNYVPVVANKMEQKGYQAQFKAGISAAGTTTSGYLEGMRTELSYDQDGTLPGYGYLYLQNANSGRVMLDFSREKDGNYNNTVKNLPASALNYDLYSVNGHGAGGMFRAFRNDIGTIYDPSVSSPYKNKSAQFEAGIPGADYGEGGDDITWIDIQNESGAWPGVQMGFTKAPAGSLYENFFFKQAGELTYNQQQEATAIFNDLPVYLKSDLSMLTTKGNVVSGYLPMSYGDAGGRILWNNYTIDRSSRAVNISYQTAEQIMKIPEMDLSKKVISYKDYLAYYNPELKLYNRYGTNASTDHLDERHHISEFTQTMPDGRRYVYGIPALNNMTKEVTMAIDEDPTKVDLAKGYVKYTSTQNSTGNTSGRDNFYSSTITPTYAHSYLLTALLSADYVDILGDGPTDDDLGTYVKYNYTLKNADYRWKTPYPKDTAQYNPGMWSDDKDGKGNYMIGSRQQWYIRTIETKNYVAEFYVSPRVDGKGVKEPIAGRYSANATDDNSYKLNEIRLYNKHDRYINKANAVPIKTVIFNYSYTLCPNTPNSFTDAASSAPRYGKLTLHKIFIKYGNSQKNLLSPYVFEYNTTNPAYNFAAKDRWGNYKRVVPGVNNYEFPYTDQPDDAGDIANQKDDLTAWNLTDIKLPSGGKIHVEYESDDYGFVQDKRSMQMLHVVGVGNTKGMIPQNELYSSLESINDYVYFKRRPSRENPSLSLKDNYLEGQDLLYYSFSLDITATGKYEHINGYAKIDQVGYCDDNPSSEYGYIKLKRDPADDIHLHPATILGINTGRYYIPHVFYDGYTSTTVVDNMKSLVGKLPELLRTIGGENPFRNFIRQHKAQKLNLAGSWIRMQTPGLTKKGGGIRVKKLELLDNWENLSGNESATFGKQYDYTIEDPRYGRISSGVASYEPMIGADENPFRSPVPYSAESGRGIPSVDFFQEEPFGESFFPAGSVGYSSVKVRSIHEQYGRSSQALDEYLFYTAKDYPYKVDYTDKDPKESAERTLFKQYQSVQVLQGYSIKLNDMHGKAKAVNNYVVHKDLASSNVKTELITGVKYYYNEDAWGNLSSQVNALVRKRGTHNEYEIKSLSLGKDVDMTVDSRYRLAKTNTNKVMINCNVLNIMGVPSPVPTVWYTNKADTKEFMSLVTTKIVQQYGILRAIESTDHGAKTTTENLVYDAETGNPLLTRTNNEFNDYECNLSYPAYLAYEGMRPAYTNDGYEEVMDSLVVNYDRDGYLYTENLDRFSDGDELLVEYKAGMATRRQKLWVLGTGTDLSVPPPTPDFGSVFFYKHKEREDCGITMKPYVVQIYKGTGPSRVKEDAGSLTAIFTGSESVDCGTPGTYSKELEYGEYSYEVTTSPGSTIVKSGTFNITKDVCIPISIEGNCPKYGRVIVTKSMIKKGSSPCENCLPYRPMQFIISKTVLGLPVPVASGILTGNYYCGYDVIYDPTMRYEKELPVLETGNYYFWAQEIPAFGSYTTVTTSFDIVEGKSVHIDIRPIDCGGSSAPPPGLPATVSITGGIASSTTSGSTARSTASPIAIIVGGKRCGLIVAPRYKDKHAGATDVSTWPSGGKVTYRNVRVKVLRSGRRNNLTQTVQQTTFKANKTNFEADHMATVNKLFDKTEGILSTSVSTYTDAAQMYESFTNEMDIPGDYKYGQFNPYVLGLRGNFRPLASYAPIAPRNYEGHARHDGDFYISSGNAFWSVVNGISTGEGCKGKTDLLRQQWTSGNAWKMASRVTRYDIFGNALEEQDAIGNYSSAQYGYNKSLPVAVASNARYQRFLFEGFEEYNMLLPQKIGELFLKGDLYTAFALLFGGAKPSSTASYYGQTFYLKDMVPASSALVLSNEMSHSGFFSLKTNSAATVYMEVGALDPTKIGRFRFDKGKYLLQLWARKSSGVITDGLISANLSSIFSADLKVKAANIDGWYLVEAAFEVPPSALELPDLFLQLELPANTFIDDVRILPLNANMKSFVYDPISFKLMAQLDENHMATFFEYDQEGLLVRTKKETSKGIVTISESRRANTKKDNSPAPPAPPSGAETGGGSESGGSSGE